MENYRKRIYFETVTMLSDMWKDETSMPPLVLEYWERASSEGIMELADEITNEFLGKYPDGFKMMGELVNALDVFINAKVRKV